MDHLIFKNFKCVYCAFAVIDIIGSIPIILNLKQKGRNVNANKATGISFALLIGFFYAGDMMLKLFQVDIASFAVAGAFVIFLMSLEMILDIEIFKNQGPIKEATLVPLVFRYWLVRERLLRCFPYVRSMLL